MPATLWLFDHVPFEQVSVAPTTGELSEIAGAPVLTGAGASAVAAATTSPTLPALNNVNQRLPLASCASVVGSPVTP